MAPTASPVGAYLRGMSPPSPSIIEFPADDPERARSFWSQLLGVELQPRRSDEGEGWQTRAGAVAVGVHARGRGPGDSVSLPYFAVQELAASLQRVQALGGSVIHPGERWAICRDSEGTPFALAGPGSGPPSAAAPEVRSYDRLEPFVTLDGSEIREWAGPVSAPARNQSLAEATIAVDGATSEHYHRLTEELYLVRAGEGRLLLDGHEQTIGVGDCALIPPGVRHKLLNTGAVPLRVVCACSPPYRDEDTVLTEEGLGT